jgi:Tfp pilus assembly protein PilE
VPAVVGVLAAIAIPQYARYRIISQENSAESACYMVALTEESYFSEFIAYTDDYNQLQNNEGLVLDSNINYGEILLYYNQIEIPCFRFTVTHKALKTKAFNYDSCADDVLTIETVKGY